MSGKRFETLTAKLTAKPVDSHRMGGQTRIQKPLECEAMARRGPRKTRFPRIRNPVLYPSELRGRTKKFKAFSDSVQSICRRLCPILCPLASGLRTFDFSILETQNGSYFSADPYVTVSLEHLFADVSG
jgi:hypothetical protein